MKFLILCAVIAAATAGVPRVTQEWRSVYPTKTVLPIQYYSGLPFPYTTTYPAYINPESTLRFITPFADKESEDKMMKVVYAGDKTLRFVTPESTFAFIKPVDDKETEDKTVKVVYAGDKDINLKYVNAAFNPENFYKVFGYYPEH